MRPRLVAALAVSPVVLLAGAGCTATPAAPAPVTTTVTATVTAGSVDPSASAAPGRVFDPVRMAADVRTVLEKTYQLTGIGMVECPAGRPVQPGTRFDCTVSLNGERRQATVTVRDGAGNYEVAPPAADVAPTTTS